MIQSNKYYKISFMKGSLEGWKTSCKRRLSWALTNGWNVKKMKGKRMQFQVKA